MRDSLFKITHNLWLETQLRAPTWAQHMFIQHLHKAKELMRLRPYLMIHRLYGYNSGGPLTVDYVGLNHKPTLTNVLFSAEPTVTETRQLPLWQVNTLANSSDPDLVVIISSKYIIHKLPRQGAIVQPSFPSMVLNIQGDWQDLKHRFHKSVQKHELRLVRKYGYEYEISHRKKDFEIFYREMYIPTMRKRHATLASPMSLREAYHHFQNGQLQLIKRDGQYVAGGVSDAQGGTIKFHLIAVLNGDDMLIHQGALGACFYAMLHWANQEGYDKVDFGGCAPRLTNSIFQNKRKWGATLTFSDTIHKEIWIKIQRDTPAIRQFFKDTVPIIIDEHGQMQGLIITDNPHSITAADREEWNKQYATPGLSGLLVRSMSDLLQRKKDPGKMG